jgi:hypothetical protein
VLLSGVFATNGAFASRPDACTLFDTAEVRTFIKDPDMDHSKPDLGNRVLPRNWSGEVCSADGTPVSSITGGDTAVAAVTVEWFGKSAPASGPSRAKGEMKHDLGGLDAVARERFTAAQPAQGLGDEAFSYTNRPDITLDATPEAHIRIVVSNLFLQVDVTGFGSVPQPPLSEAMQLAKYAVSKLPTNGRNGQGG